MSTVGTKRVRRVLHGSALALIPGAFWLVAPVSISAQNFGPHIGYVYPAGGRQGTVLQVKVGGQFLDGVTNVCLSGPGMQARVLEHTKPLTQQQFNNLRDKLKELQDKRAAAAKNWRRGRGSGSGTSTNVVWTAEDDKMVADIRKKIATFVRRPANPAIAETVTLQVSLATNSEPGQCELRLATTLGLSNPLVFRVGQLPEFYKKEIKPSDDGQGFRPFRNNAEQKASPPTETTITLPATINGQTLQGGVDRYRFQARQGQSLVVQASARELIPYLPDAVPGWFQPTLALYDSNHKEIAYDDDFRFHPDPVLHYEIPKDGEYSIEIKDAIYRGREDFVYRISIGELPFITGIFPLGGKLGAETTVKVSGWNLPSDQLTLGKGDVTPGVVCVSMRKDGRVSNLVPFALDTLTEAFEQEPNDSISNAQKVTMPVIINGRIDKPGDCDVFQFEGRAGAQVVAEVYARRLDSPLDSVLKLTDAAGRQLAFNDDNEDKGSGLNTHHADSRLNFTLPANGTYFVQIGDTQRQGGQDYAYRLRLSAPRPDFELRVVPSSITLRGGACAPVTVYALRRDGFTNEIGLALNDAPRGFNLNGARIPAGADQVRLTLSAGGFSSREPVTLSLEGRAIVDGHAVVHPVIPAEDMMQAFAYHHLVPAKELKVAALGRGMLRPPGLASDTAVKIPAGGTARVRLTGPAFGFADRFQFELNDPPEGLELRNVAPGRDGAELVLQSDAAKLKPGLKGNLIVSIYPGKNGPAGNKNKKQPNVRRVAVGTLPAIPFEIVSP